MFFELLRLYDLNFANYIIPDNFGVKFLLFYIGFPYFCRIKDQKINRNYFFSINFKFCTEKAPFSRFDVTKDRKINCSKTTLDFR